MTSVLIVDDQELIRAGLRAVVDGSGGIRVVAEAGSGAEAARLAGQLLPDVVLMDLRMPEMDGIEATRIIRADPRLAATRVLVLTTFDGDAEVIAALRAGASGFLAKSAGPDELVDAIHAVAQGRAALTADALSVAVEDAARRTARSNVDDELLVRVGRLTDREREIAAHVAQGVDNLTIAARLHISPFTVKSHLNRAMAKLGARDRAQVVVLAHRAGLAE